MRTLALFTVLTVVSIAATEWLIRLAEVLFPDKKRRPR